MSKQVKPSNIIMDCIIGGVVLVLLIVAGASVMKGKNNSTDTKKATPKPVTKEAGVTKYRCIIQDGSSNATVFGLDFNSGDMTYKEYLEAGDKSTELDNGSYEEKDGKWITTSKKNQEVNTYVRDGDYLLAEDEIYSGKLPKGTHFNATFTYEKKGICKNTLKFHVDGTYEETVLSYGEDGNSQEDTTKTIRGTYERKEATISRTTEGGEQMLDFYIYGSQITNAYYQLEK